MIKNSYQKEISISAIQKRKGSANISKEVYKIQIWLCLYAFTNPLSGTATGIDGDFGQATETAVKNYQKAIGVTQDGVVTPTLFQRMCSPMTEAFKSPTSAITFRDKIISVANAHVKANARELTIKGKTNSGPWVRAYMDGNEGNDWLWCMGFVQTVMDQASSASGFKFTDFMIRSFSCDTVAAAAKTRGNFVKYSAVRANPSLVEKGDIFLLQSSNNSLDWIHTGIVTKILENGVFETIEGNTNDDGSRNGYAVVKRTRNFVRSKMDIVKVTLLT